MTEIQRTYFAPPDVIWEGGRQLGMATTTEDAAEFDRMGWQATGLDDALYVAGSKRALAKGITRCRRGIIKFGDMDRVECRGFIVAR